MNLERLASSLNEKASQKIRARGSLGKYIVHNRCEHFFCKFQKEVIISQTADKYCSDFLKYY